ncbi:phosphomannomutase/phosphoglucomutase [Bordetella holmesii]|uniref:Phosphomannomutase/phosphoglucomutase n=2 Tax=Bordetella holmesii TaxID=35814 RepID=A0A158M8N9_9BORD|nr:phosphomannomutase/phosphoglucomutase [Bordetella holmesii]AIT25155.1 phosphoglucomutase/phosphomannomutase, C-terminal domain protein [Bordetella holmesii 44057]EWM45721.1 phosphoglucomutase/phosphomannomutase, C-terminal domain protein [Bordetella holmesii 70147]EWM48678.1 phosphoglucomutase/phosphomannomutase, C-terminal domain protein [Bordetella holmesii 41130]AMD44390.1 phosphoglucomutase [Bordetella holmesii H558]AMD50094.1 phosphoglucomutase [Bordetella holmesii F627]
MKNTYPASVFKAYDIRGTVPDLIDAPFARSLGFALAKRARSCGNTELVVGYDGRLSSPDLAVALQEGILEGGVNTFDIGCVPTPLVYFAAYSGQLGAGVAITGSHNPPKYNGFKMMLGGRALYGDDVQALRADMQAPEGLSADRAGTRRTANIVPEYIKRVVSDITLARPMKIAIDCGNGVAGAVAPQLFRALGCDVTELFCEVDGNFPNHHPDSADPHNLQDLIDCLATTDCEIGLAFDGDGDRLGVVTKSGQIIWPDRQLILFARDVLQRCPGQTIIYDVKCSRHVGLAVEQAGGKPLMWQTGHSLVKAKLAETGAPLAGEMSGHIFFKERWYGFDDGLYTGARLLEIISRESDPSALLEALPTAESTPELKLEMEEGQPHALIRELQAHGRFDDATQLITIDGVRAEFTDGFGLARASNTTPVVVLRFEAENAAALARIQTLFKRELLRLAPQARLPF